jgi:hypothetical protein
MCPPKTVLQDQTAQILLPMKSNVPRRWQDVNRDPSFWIRIVPDFPTTKTRPIRMLAATSCQWLLYDAGD